MAYVFPQMLALSNFRDDVGVVSTASFIPNMTSWIAEGAGDDLDGGDEDGGRVEGFELNGEVGGLVGKTGPENAAKNVLHKIIFVLRSDNSSVNAVPLAANRISRLQHDIQSNS